MSASGRSSATRMRGSSAAPSATSCSCGPYSTSTSRARSRVTPRIASRAASAGRCFPLSERHGAWRVVVDGVDETVDFTPVGDGIDADLATRDFTFNAIAVHVRTGEPHDPHDGRADLEAGVIRAVSESIFVDDPLRLLRAVRFEDELGFRMDERTEALLRASAALVTQPAGERDARRARAAVAGRRTAGSTRSGCSRRSAASSTPGWKRSTTPTSASWSCSAKTSPAARSRTSSSATLRRLRRARRPEDPSPRSIHRFRRDTEPWALDALAFVGAPELVGVVEAARRADPAEPLVRGDELGLEPGPAIGRILDAIDEERAAGTISTREEALALARVLGGGCS